MALVVTYNHDEWQERTFDILVDGVRVGEQTIERRGPMRFFDVEYPVPAELVKGKQKVTVKFQADPGQRNRRRLRPPHDPRRRRALDRSTAALRPPACLCSNGPPRGQQRVALDACQQDR